MKPSRLFIITLAFLFLVSFHTDAQSKWWRYGVDESVVIQVRQQPRIIDTLGQTFIIAETEYGGILINKMPNGESYYSSDDVERFNRSLLKGVTMSGETEVISHQADTLQNIPCLRFTFQKPSQNLEGHGLGVVAGNNSYVFQFVYSPENAAKATVEREHFFNSIEFSTRVTGVNQNAKRAGYLFGMGLGFLALAAVPLIVVALVIIAISYYRRKSS